MTPSSTMERIRSAVASQVLVVTGMHRSGTSLVSGLLQSAGVHVGENLIAANPANPRGYFEDVDFYEFHEHLLHQRGRTYLYAEAPDSDAFEPTPEELQRAKRLIDTRSAHPVWGWKDPRTSLFLDFWRKLLPESRFLFVYRHPLEVLLSLLRRGEFDEHPNLAVGLQAWQAYNLRIADFFQRHPDDCLLVHIDAAVANFERFSELLVEKLRMDLSLSPAEFRNAFHESELHRTDLPPAANLLLGRLYPDLLRLYHRLNATADLPALSPEGPSERSPVHAELQRFAAAMADWPNPVGASAKQAALQLLVAAIEPQRTDEMLRKFNDSAKGLQAKVDMHWLHAQQLERNYLNQERELVDRDQALAQLRETTASLEAQITAKDSEITSQQSQLAEQQSQLQNQLARIDSQQSQLKIQQSQFETQRSQLEFRQSQLESMKSQLASRQSQLDIQQTTLETQQARLESQRSQLERQQSQLENQQAQLEDQRIQLTSQRTKLTLQQSRLSSQELQIAEQDRLLRRNSDRVGKLLAELDSGHHAGGTLARVWARIKRSIWRSNTMSITKTYQSSLPSPIQGSMAERIAQVRELQAQLHTRPVTGTLRGFKQMVFQTIRSTFSRQFALNAVTVDLIESLHRELERMRPQLETQTEQMQSQSAALAPPAAEQRIETGVVMASCGVAQDQAQLNGVRPLPGFNFVYTAPAEMRMPERVALYGLIFGLQPKNCLEIGTFRGGSTAIIFGALDDTGAGQLACVDPNPQVEPQLWGQLARRCRLFPGSSPKILPEVEAKMGGKFDFALIDGDHPYESVKQDLSGVLTVLADHAYMLFHDAHSDGVKRAVDEAVAENSALTDCGMISVEPTVFEENGVTKLWAGLRLVRFQRPESK